MQTFLQIAAADLFRRFDGHFENVTVVFPNKRASLFFNQHLFELAGHPIWAPHYTTISELFQSMSTLTVADPIQLVCMLYKAYCETGDGLAEETLDQFWSWGELMLSDFQDIDNNMVDARRLFTNISDIDDLTSLDYLTPEQIEALRHFFPNFHESTELKERFLSVWKRLLPTYERFRQMLLDENLAYEGMMKREVVESAVECRKGAYAFIGFNVLNETERQLFRHLREEAETLFYWDYDVMYLHQGKSVFEAGRFIRQNILDFGNAMPDPDIYDNFSRPKQIRFISSPTENAQTRHAGSLLQSLHASTSTPHTSPSTAVILCNEALLQPMLHAIPDDTEVNITMGFPLAGTPVSSLLIALTDLQQRGRAGHDAWRYNAVATILRHPLVHAMTGEVCVRLLQTLNDRHVLFPTLPFFAENDFLATIFTPKSNTGDLLAWLIDIVERIGKGLSSRHSAVRQTDTNSEIVDIEAVFGVYTMLSRLQLIHEQALLNIDPVTLQRLLMQIIKAKTIPFHGEPAVGLQVMGILETRNLDFRNVLMLSVGEGNLPRRNNNSSFIPYNLREAYGMTTVEKQTSLFAYYFYRLLQRAENVWLYYNSSTEGTSRGEMSRFMMQLLTDSTHISNIQQLTLTAGYTPLTPQVLQVEKSPEVIQRLKARFTPPTPDHPDGRPLSPSALNTWLNCPLQFYLHYVAALRPDDQLTEDIGDDIFGNIFHYCMEHIYRQRIGLGREVQANDLLALVKNTEDIGHLVDEAFNMEFFKRPESEKNRPPRYNGEQLLNREVLITYVRDQLRYDATLCPLSVYGVEEKVRLGMLGGTIDRIDCVTIDGQRQLRIVDYKTSSSVKAAKSIDALFERQNPNRSTHILQAFYYADLYTTLHPDQPVAPALMYVKLARGNDPQRQTRPVVTLGSEKEKITVTDFAAQCKTDYHQQLQKCIDDIFNPELPFTQDPTGHACQWCNFAQLCGRNT